MLLLYELNYVFQLTTCNYASECKIRGDLKSRSSSNNSNVCRRFSKLAILRTLAQVVVKDATYILYRSISKSFIPSLHFLYLDVFTKYRSAKVSVWHLHKTVQAFKKRTYNFNIYIHSY